MTLGPKEGVCNICGEFGRLTKDHSPPKSCTGASFSEMTRLHSRLASSSSEERPRFFRRGPTFRTLCARCNNDLLGANYDPALASVCKQVRALAGATLALPPILQFVVKPQLVMRSVLGHLSAIGLDRYKKGDMTEPLRSYILDRDAPLPSGIAFYYWLYPYPGQVLVRDAGLINFDTHEPTVFWLMKFYPIAFFITFNSDAAKFDVGHLHQFGRLSSDAEVTIDLRLRPLVHQRWPEAPTDNSAILYGEGALAVNPRTKLLPS